MVETDRSGTPPIRNAMSVDIEDYFQVGAFEKCIRRADWGNFKGRVEYATDDVIALYGEHDVKATFFILGWVAERYPQLIQRIVNAGHEIASHGYDHKRVHDLTPESFRKDIIQAKKILEDISGTAIKGYRAPSFSISANNFWALEILAEEGYRYSSSVYPISHDHYGMPEAPRFSFRPVDGSPMIELPMTTVNVFGKAWPCSGGGYFRLLPYPISKWAIGRVNREDCQPCIFYFHPWEIDPEQPRQHQAGAKSKFRHYTNLKSMRAKLGRVLGDFQWGRIDEVFLA